MSDRFEADFGSSVQIKKISKGLAHAGPWVNDSLRLVTNRYRHMAENVRYSPVTAARYSLAVGKTMARTKHVTGDQKRA